MLQIIQTDDFARWLQKLKDKTAKHAILARLVRMELGNFGDAKLVGDGVSEARIHIGAGYRLYFTTQGKKLIVMLAGGDKSSLHKDIKHAKLLAEQWRQQ